MLPTYWRTLLLPNYKHTRAEVAGFTERRGHSTSRINKSMNQLTEDRHSEALRAWRRWKVGRFHRERDAAIVQLWLLCEREIWAVAGELARRMGNGPGQTHHDPYMASFPGLDRGQCEVPGVSRSSRGGSEIALMLDAHKGAFQTNVILLFVPLILYTVFTFSQITL
jgi:hypothetical protein